jgi:hypothetical protein
MLLFLTILCNISRYSCYIAEKLTLNLGPYLIKKFIGVVIEKIAASSPLQHSDIIMRCVNFLHGMSILENVFYEQLPKIVCNN